MCGIFATTRPDLWDGLVSDVQRSLHHRGPDATGIWRSPSGRALLVHTRLSIIGLGPEGSQPRHSGDSRLAITYNGEIYNFKELADGSTPAASDTQVLADLISRDGIGGLARVRGMYAFAAWDEEHGRLVAARDPFGIKPLYVLHHSTGGVTLASSLTTLLLLSEARAVDPVGLAHYVAFGHTGPALTLFERINKLAPGSVWEWELDGSTKATRFDRAPVPAPSGLGAALADSVAAHLVADVEVGVFLSAGTDSTLVAAMAAEQQGTVRTFTLSFPERPEMDESPLAEANAKLLGAKHRTVPFHADQLPAAAADLMKIHGEPFGDAAALPLLVLARHASEDLKVVLTGEGSDELLGGYGRYRISRLLEHRLVRTAGKAGAPAAHQLAKVRTDRPRTRAMEALLWGGGHRSHAALVGSDLNAILGTHRGFGDVEKLYRTDWEAAREDAGETATARRFDTERWLPNVYLEKTDRATMASGLEARVPFLDPVFAAAAAASRARAFGKQELHDELLHRLPDVRQPDRKKGLAVDVRPLVDGPLARHVRFELSSPSSLVSEVLGPAAAAALSARVARSSTSAFRIAMLGLWEELQPGSP